MSDNNSGDMDGRVEDYAGSCANSKTQNRVSINQLYIVMPVYNEERRIAQAVTAWHAALDEVGGEKLVVDVSGSSDRTRYILRDLVRFLPKLKVIHHNIDGCGSYGAKLQALCDYALAEGANYIAQVDVCDCLKPRELMNLWVHRSGYEAVLICRKSNFGDGWRNWLAERVQRILMRAFLGASVPDADSPFRLISARLLAEDAARKALGYNWANVLLAAYLVRHHRASVLLKEVKAVATQEGGTIPLRFSELTDVLQRGWGMLKELRRFRHVIG